MDTKRTLRSHDIEGVCVLILAQMTSHRQVIELQPLLSNNKVLSDVGAQLHHELRTWFFQCVSKFAKELFYHRSFSDGKRSSLESSYI